MIYNLCKFRQYLEIYSHLCKKYLILVYELKCRLSTCLFHHDYWSSNCEMNCLWNIIICNQLENGVEIKYPAWFVSYYP